ncbi:MAG: hypothetical protein WCF65_02080 [Parachlamydiaceae bacterium]
MTGSTTSSATQPPQPEDDTPFVGFPCDGEGFMSGHFLEKIKGKSNSPLPSSPGSTGSSTDRDTGDSGCEHTFSVEPISDLSVSARAETFDTTSAAANTFHALTRPRERSTVISRPKMTVEERQALMDSTAKKVKAIESQLKKEGISNITTLHSTKSLMQRNVSVLRTTDLPVVVYDQSEKFAEGSFKDLHGLSDRSAAKMMALALSLKENSQPSPKRAVVDEAGVERSENEALKDIANTLKILNNPLIKKAENHAGLPLHLKPVIVISSEGTAAQVGFIAPRADQNGAELAEDKTTTVTQRLRCVHDIGNGLNLVHRAEYAHGDVHLANILICEGSAHLSDFSTMTTLKAKINRDNILADLRYRNMRGSLKQSDKHGYAILAYCLLTNERWLRISSLYKRTNDQKNEINDQSSLEKSTLDPLVKIYGEEQGQALFEGIKKLIEIPLTDQGKKEGHLESKMEIPEFLEILRSIQVPQKGEYAVQVTNDPKFLPPPPVAQCYLDIIL